jgi:nucleotide sugar dehydrogenase
MKINDSIGIVGNGFVGNAVYQGFKKHFNLVVYDTDPSKKINTLDEVDKTEIIFLCVPTPMNSDGSFVLSFLLDSINNLSSGKILLIKSTIPPSYAEYLIKKFPKQKLIFNPEFLTERTAVEDFQNPSRIILGGEDREAIEKAERMYRKIFPSTMVRIIKTDYKTACFIKYFSNCFFATKVSLMNEFKQIADTAGINWDTALTGLLLSDWVNPMHTLVPGPDGKLGFGGKCFPKDICAFILYCKENGIDPTVLEAAWKKNQEVRNPEETE